MEVKEIKNKEALFNILYERHYNSVKKLAFKVFKNELIAEDIAVKAMCVVYKNIHSYDEKKGVLSQWIYAVTRNIIIDYKRNFNSIEKKFKENMLNFENIDLFDFEDSEENEQEILNEMILKVHEVINSLKKERTRNVMKMKYIDGISFVEIAKLLGMEFINVKVLAHRTREKIKSQLL